MAREFRKTLSYSDLATFLEDQELYIERITSPRKPWEHLHQLVGETVHAMAAADDRARDRILDRRLAEVPEEEKEAARSKIMQMIETADALATPAESTSQEEQLSWRSEEHTSEGSGYRVDFKSKTGRDIHARERSSDADIRPENCKPTEIQAQEPALLLWTGGCTCQKLPGTD